MKKKMMSIMMLVMVCCAVNVFGMEFGLKAGPQLSETMSRTEGTKLGVFAAFNIGSKFKLQPEMYLSIRKLRYAGESFGTTGLYGTLWLSDSVKYLEIPVLVKYTFELKSDFRPVVFGGFYGAVKVGSNPDQTVEWWENPLKATPRSYNSFEGGLIFGVGLEHGRGKTRMMLDLRYNYGMTNMRKLGVISDYNITVYSSKNRAVSVMAGFGF